MTNIRQLKKKECLRTIVSATHTGQLQVFLQQRWPPVELASWLAPGRHCRRVEHGCHRGAAVGSASWIHRRIDGQDELQRRQKSGSQDQE